ncbi:hypothetical protein [Caudoviricetes sp.]|nr:hypothetical protein [Caudoviricetes sp.]
MIYVHTYKYVIDGQEDYIQFYEYEPTHGMKVIDSHDIPIALLFPRKLQPRQYMRNLIKHYFGDIAHVIFVSSVEFDMETFDMA